MKEVRTSYSEYMTGADRLLTLLQGNWTISPSLRHFVSKTNDRMICIGVFKYSMENILAFLLSFQVVRYRNQIINWELSVVRSFISFLNILYIAAQC